MSGTRGRGRSLRVSVVIPCYKVSRHIFEVIKKVGPEVSKIYVVDDACPEQSGKIVAAKNKDPRVEVLYLEQNLGVGGAVMAGYVKALADGAEVIVKLDGDGQMWPEDIPQLVKPIVEKRADYSKGNRFDSLDDLSSMPKVRILGNAVLSLMTKISSGYWKITDPTNGFTAVHHSVLKKLHFGKISNRYFFESDMLFRLSVIRAVVADVPMPARYGDEKSNLRISKVLVEFPIKHLKNYLKRIFYLYYLREWSIASLELPAGIALCLAGITFGSTKWLESISTGLPTNAGSVMIVGLALIFGFQLVLAFINYDITSEPKSPKQLEL